MAKYLLFLVGIAALLVFSQAQGSGCTIDTFKVNGNGQIFLTPDIATLSIMITGNGNTASAALTDVNNQINNLIAALKNLGIPATNYTTQSINIYDVYNYQTTPYTITGSQATQTIQLIIGASTNLTAILQSLQNASLQSIVYDIKNRSNALQKARAAAFADAKTKFAQYLTLSGNFNAGLRKILDLNSDVFTTYQYSPNVFLLSNKLSSPPAPVQVSANVQVTWSVRP